MRVLLTTPVFPPARGGIERVAHRLATLLPGCEVRVVALDEPGAGAFDVTLPIAVDRVANAPRGGRRAVLALNAATVRVGRAWRPDVTLAMHMAATPAARLLRASLGIPFVVYVHAKETRALPYLTAAGMPAAARIVAVSRYARSLALEAGADAERVRLLPPGVDLPAATGRGRDPVPTLVTVSRLEDRNKGHDVVMEALPRIAARVPAVRWVVIGGGPLRPELERSARALGVEDRVTFAGALPDTERDAWLDRAWLYVMPTRLPHDGRGGEGFGLVYVEAAAHGLPAVGSRVPGVVDAVEDGKTGVLVPPEQPAAVADAVVALLHDEPRRAALGADGRERAADLAWDRVAARAGAVLREAAAVETRVRRGPRRLRRVLWPADLLLPERSAAVRRPAARAHRAVNRRHAALVICSKSPWEPAIRREHALAARAASVGRPVTFVEQPADVRALGRVGPLRWARGLRGAPLRRAEEQRVAVVARSIPVPGHRSSLAQSANTRLLGRVLTREAATGAAVVACVPWDWDAVRAVRGVRRVLDLADDWSRLMPGREARFEALYRRVAAEADAVIVVNRELARHFPGREVVVVRNGVESDLVDAPVAARPRPKAMLYLGTLSPRFDAALMRAVLARLPDWTLELVGPRLYPGRSGAAEAELERLLALPTVRWHGAVPRRDLPARLDAASVLVLPNRPERSLGQDSMKLYDYAARGRPVVTTRWGAAVDEHPPPRLRVADDADAFAAGVADAVEEPPEWREERRAWARAHTWEQRWPRWAAAVFGSA